MLTEIVRNGVIAVTEEMKTNLTRTAYNMIIYEALDFTVGLYTAEGETVSIGIGLPSFIRGMANTVGAMLQRYGKGGLCPGDILVTNDAYITGSHLNHFTFCQPIFFDGVLSGWAACMAHWADVGGSLGGVTTDIYSEGIQIPILKYSAAGVINEDLLDIIRMNVRISDRAMGDLRAQVVAVTTGTKRFTELLMRYQREPVLAAIANIMDQSERAARARTLTIPDGIYEAESFMDDDGVAIGSRIPIKVRVIKKGDEMTIDLSQVSSQVRGFFNSGPSTGYSCAQVAYKCLTSPTDYPINEGSFRSLKVISPAGTVISAIKPAAMRKWMTFPMTVVDTVIKAMEAAIPKRVSAAHHADLVVAAVHGLTRGGDFYIGIIGPTGGGWGAKHNEDGMSGVVCSNDGDTHNSPAEQLEAKYPVLIERHALRVDSGGAGKHRGGLGTEVVVSARTSFTTSVQADRTACPPWGLQGAGAGMGNQVALRIDGKEVLDPASSKIYNQRLKPGDAMILRAGGGGGYGPAIERDAAMVAHDVAQGYVSADVARDVYQVAVDAEGALNATATQALRSAPQTASR